MAKARPVEGLSADDAYGTVAAAVVDVRTEELLAHSEGVLDLDEIENLHDMRVATRRLRAALEVFAPCFPSKRYKATLKEVKALADALGRRRDPDVTALALADFAAAAPRTDRPGVESLIASIERERSSVNDELVGVLEPERLEALAARLRGLASAARERAGS